MAENDTHYNGNPEMMNNGNYGRGSIPATPIPSPTPETGNNSIPATPIPMPSPETGGNDMPMAPIPMPMPSPDMGGGNSPMFPFPTPEAGGPNAPTGRPPVFPYPTPEVGGPTPPTGRPPVRPYPTPEAGGPNAPTGRPPVFPYPTPEVGGPGTPGGNFPIFPLPGVGCSPSTGCFPLNPGFPPGSSQYYGRVRFLNASTNNFPVNISIDNSAYALNSRFGTITNYDWIPDGFHTVTVRRATGLRTILLQQNFPFVAGQRVTMVLTDTPAGGLELVRVIDTGCSNLPYNSGCFRFANMSYSGSSFDLMLYNGETVFRTVRFQNATPYKQAIAGSYQFYVTNSGAYAFARELPIIVIGVGSTAGNLREAVATFTVDIAAGRNYTSYIIGNTWSGNSLRVITIEDSEDFS